jgi:hypothetical protein
MNYLCTYDLYGPVRNAFDAGSIHYLGKWKGGWALEIESLLGPVKWHRADRRVPFHQLSANLFLQCSFFSHKSGISLILRRLKYRKSLASCTNDCLSLPTFTYSTMLTVLYITTTSVDNFSYFLLVCGQFSGLVLLQLDISCRVHYVY